MTENLINYSRIKHINVIYYYVKNKIVDELIELMYISITDMMTDELIKFLKAVKFESFRSMMKMSSVLEKTVWIASYLSI